MGVISTTQEFNSAIAPLRMFKAFIIDSNKLLPKLLPQFIKSIDLIQGTGGAGSIEQINFTEGSEYNSVKHRIEEVDEENLVCKYAMIEGDALGDKLEYIAYEVKFEAASNGGCICKMISNFHIIGNFQIKEEEIEAGKETVMGIYKVVEKYLLDNPQVYA
ncbi:major allergen Pru ar 1-like [Melia azedarach]|uniref:Major allergen Pru ar 1-like n=1 Tax=Melia azedarach TaxID=155640 RepID=A0ACC1YEL4_MELAZ|nr:major allergen Pru ar 1-like [Melia azedarach]